MENGNGKPQKTIAEIRQEIKNYFSVCAIFCEPLPVKRIENDNPIIRKS